MKQHTKEQLDTMKLPELKALAKKLGVATAGMRMADLKRAIAKKEKAANGKGTPASPAPKGRVAKKAVKKATKKPPVEEEEAEEDEEEEKSVKKATKKAAEKPAAADDLRSLVAAIVSVLTEVAAVCDVDASAISGMERFAEAAAKSSKAAKAPPPDEDEEEEAEEEEEEEEGDEEETELDISAEELATANHDRLTEIATQINKAVGEDAIEIVKSTRLLREYIREFLDENATKVADGDEEEEEEEEEEQPEGAPDWAKKGARVKALYDGTWYKGKIVSMDADGAVVEYDTDGSESEVPWEDIKPLRKAAD